MISYPLRLVDKSTNIVCCTFCLGDKKILPSDCSLVSPNSSYFSSNVSTPPKNCTDKKYPTSDYSSASGSSGGSGGGGGKKSTKNSNRNRH